MVFGSTGPESNKSVEIVAENKQTVKSKQKYVLCTFTLFSSCRVCVWVCVRGVRERGFNLASRTFLLPHSLPSVVCETSQCHAITCMMLFQNILNFQHFLTLHPSRKLRGGTQQINNFLCVAPNHNPSVWQKHLSSEGLRNHFRRERS